MATGDRISPGHGECLSMKAILPYSDISEYALASNIGLPIRRTTASTSLIVIGWHQLHALSGRSYCGPILTTVPGLIISSSHPTFKLIKDTRFDANHLTRNCLTGAFSRESVRRLTHVE
jgi:hypothetical protein